MLDRRTFVLRTAAGIGSTLALTLTGTAAAKATEATSAYRRISVHWTGHRLVRILDREPRAGDFTGFAQVRNGKIISPIDLFKAESSSSNDDRDYILTPVGRVEDLADGRRAIQDR